MNLNHEPMDLTEVQKKLTEFNSLVHTVFSTAAGKQLMAEFDNALMKPIYHADSSRMYMAEGQRAFILDLKQAYELGGKQ